MAVRWLQGPRIPKWKDSARPHMHRNATAEVLRGSLLTVGVWLPVAGTYPNSGLGVYMTLIL